MNGRSIRRGAIIIVLILAAGVWAQARASIVDIRFSFVAAGKKFEPGTYSVDIASNGNVVLTPDKGGAAVEIPRIKKLGNRNVKKAELVFDVVGSARFLAQVWLPGKDGCLVGRQNEAQAQQTVKGPKADQ
jgi:hypothetical protein